ncbi:hypothetical protein AB0F93_00220 [Micromonospora tulbaghiae]|uniref:hypothetical protein n=1 Tax=Micromonospora tulbaghiae TaxID=479978 RepID=UPI003319B37A
MTAPDRVRRFRIHTSGRIGPPRWWWVVVHPGVEELRAAGDAWLRRQGAYADLSDAVGLCQPVGWMEYEESPRERHYPASGYAGVVRLAVGEVTAEIVAHELVHAAVATYRMNVRPDVRLGVQCGGREEDLAYLYGELFASFQDRY